LSAKGVKRTKNPKFPEKRGARAALLRGLFGFLKTNSFTIGGGCFMKNNKSFRKAPVLVLASVIALVFAGCTTTYHYQKGAAAETQATLKVAGSVLTVVALDEVGVKWKGSLLGNTVYLPAGPHTLTVNYKKGSSVMAFYGMGSTQSANAMHIGENFLPGHTYQLASGSGGGSVAITITDITAAQAR
jgi:hypothetical protein